MSKILEEYLDKTFSRERAPLVEVKEKSNSLHVNAEGS